MIENGVTAKLQSMTLFTRTSPGTKGTDEVSGYQVPVYNIYSFIFLLKKKWKKLKKLKFYPLYHRCSKHEHKKDWQDTVDKIWMGKQSSCRYTVKVQVVRAVVVAGRERKKKNSFTLINSSQVLPAVKNKRKKKRRKHIDNFLNLIKVVPGRI